MQRAVSVIKRRMSTNSPRIQGLWISELSDLGVISANRIQADINFSVVPMKRCSVDKLGQRGSLRKG